MRDYYETLGVAREADADAIKKAYRKLAMQYHPDRNNGSADAAEKFKEATEAYEVLRDTQKRAAYDRFGHAGVKAGAGAGPGFGGFDFSDALETFMREFGGLGLDDLFGGRTGRPGGGQRRRGSDLRVRAPLSLSEVATGVHKELRVSLLDACSGCGGTGGADGAPAARCATCDGTGEVRRVQRSLLGQLVSVGPCPTCGGEGQRIERPCGRCRGEGVERTGRVVGVDVPPGVSSGDYLTLRGQGNAGLRGSPRGDILVVMEVEEDPRFVREGADLICEIPITFTQAVLGVDVDVPTVTGSARLKVPPGTQSGRLLRMRGRGLPRLQAAGSGDQIVRIVVWVPNDLTGEQERRIRDLAEVESPAPERLEHDGDGGFWSKVRSAFTA